jgi:succinate dehydrogenase / fumarate reductase iron-sulfur subunit
MSTGITKPEEEEETESQAVGAARAAGESAYGQARMDEAEIDAANQKSQRRARRAVENADRTVELKVFRYDPEVPEKEEPRFDSFTVPFAKGMTVLDALMWARDHYDSSLTFRHSCRQAVCGSDALFVDGKQRLGCKTQVADLADDGIPGEVRIEPLPHAEVVKDLVVDMEHFYDQMESVEPYFQDEDTPDGLNEQRQSRENREKIKMSTRCIWCGACMSSCNIAAGNNEYLGPAAINKAYRFAMDEREGEDLTEHRLNIIEQEHGVWRCQTQFSCTEVCPKDIPLTEHIQALKREAVKKNLKFW